MRTSSSTPERARHANMHLLSWCWGDTNRQFLRDHWPAILAYLASPGYQGKTLPHKMRCTNMKTYTHQGNTWFMLTEDLGQSSIEQLCDHSYPEPTWNSRKTTAVLLTFRAFDPLYSLGRHYQLWQASPHIVAKSKTWLLRSRGCLGRLLQQFYF